MIDSTALRAFAAFAEDANLSRTARRLHLSQPAVHAQLKRLSEALGVPLYERAGRGLVLTREGVEVAAFARDAEERARDLVARLRGEGEARRVVLAAGAGALLHVLGEGLRAFARAYEGRLDIVTADGAAAVDAVARGVAHVGVTAAHEARTWSDLEEHRLTEVGQVLVVPRDHRLASRRRVTLADLEGERLVMPPEGRPQRAALDAAFAARGVKVNAGALATGWELVLRLVELGAGVAVVNGSVRVPRELVSKPLRELPRIRYVALTRRRPRADAAALVDALSRNLRSASSSARSSSVAR
ncbi:MAG: LysR family transcriptional regulator [Labilithrix sp.]|nr:LysR family transcriptional regulator [Labilithrix sp.]